MLARAGLFGYDSPICSRGEVTKPCRSFGSGHGGREQRVKSRPRLSDSIDRSVEVQNAMGVMLSYFNL